MRQALVVGIDSGIGGALAKALAVAGWRVLGSSRRGTAGMLPLDLAALPESLAGLRADVCFVCAAVTRQAECVADEAVAWRVNAEAPGRIAQAVAAAGGRTLLLSTNAVFDGRLACRAADAPPCPVNSYGRQKAEAERAVLATPGAAVLRLTKVLTPTLPLFRNWIAALRQGRAVTAFGDMVMAPVALDAVTAALVEIAAMGADGIFQASATADISYAEACRHIARRLGIDPSLVKAVPAAGVPASDRPLATSLDASRLADLTGRAVPAPLDVIDRVFGFVAGGDC
ncbi:MAG TPA: sugar nucleotide-binding protein [Patescibacteria group bacterium]|nr:sugar nucleotide-binding protein [Patescibacteria group bacterium]